MINAKSTDVIRIEVDKPNGRAVTLTGEQWINIFDMYNELQDKVKNFEGYDHGPMFGFKD